MTNESHHINESADKITLKTKIKCPKCGRVFESNSGMKVHHAKKHGESIAGVTIVCDYCGQKTEKRQRKSRNDHEFCSKECYNNWYSENLSGENSHRWEGGKIEVQCDWCGETTEKKPVDYKKAEKTFCDQSCHGEWLSEHKTGESNPVYKPERWIECDWCGKEHYKSEYKQERNENHFCGQECRGEWQSQTRTGENHPRWVENPEYISYGGSWPEKREERLEKDGYECVVCGKSQAQQKRDIGRGLEVHHIQKAKKFVQDDGTLNEEMAHRMENLITLCTKCHRRWEGIPLKPQVNYE